jgi:serine/threonine protein kinase/Tfp pilus assembly protein PilF
MNGDCYSSPWRFVMAVQKLDEEAIFNVARKIESPEARKNYLDQACGEDAALRARVQDLLRVHEADKSYLQSPVPTIAEPLSERPGAVIGPYKLIQEIGEGGMGTVYLAQQTEPVKRLVALKVIKPGMDSRQVIARFEAERQALAMMDHPHIARVFDAGATTGEPGGVSAGRPFFVMELVKGTPVTKYCDEHRLTPRQRLELFVPVCQAIQHAHHKGIIHRDVKPSNVLVAPYDGKPVVKVIDFGVAKATGQRLTERTLVTGFGAVVGTLEYMSPEQAELNNQDIDTRSDIYSLGVLLYELLTGTTPLSHERFRDTPFTEVLRIIRDEEPPKPSTRLSSLETLPTIAASRQTEPAKLTKLVRGELDWIVMKALEKRRNRRYETASAFAADLQRYLNDEPVQACPPSAWYRLGKFARRNKMALTIASAAGLAVVLAVVLLGVSNAVITHERDEKQDALNQKEEALGLKEQALGQKDQALQQKAQALVEMKREKDRANENLVKARKAVYNYLFATAANPRLADADLHAFRKDLVSKAIPFLEDFVKQKEGDPELEAERGKAYYVLAFVRAELGEGEQALENYERARAIFARLAAELPKDPDDRRLLAYSHNELGSMFRGLGNYPEAEKAFREALVIQQQLVDEFPKDPHYGLELAGTHNNLGIFLLQLGRPAEAKTHYGNGLDLRTQLAAKFPALPQCRQDLARSHNSFGVLLVSQGQRAEAEAHYRQALEIQEKLVAEFPGTPAYRDDWAGTHLNYGELLQRLGKLPDAETHFRQAVSLQERLAADFPSVQKYRHRVASMSNGLGYVLRMLDKVPEAEAAHRRALDLLQKLAKECPAVPEYRKSLADTYGDLGSLLRALSRRDEADAALLEAVAGLQKLAAEIPAVPEYQSDLGGRINNLAMLRMDQGKLAEARKLLEQAIVHQQAALKVFPAHPTYRQFLRNHYMHLAETLVRLKEHTEAAKAVHARIGLQPAGWWEFHQAAAVLIRCAIVAEKDAQLSRRDRQAAAQAYAGQAKELLTEAIERSKDDAGGLHMLARFLANHADPRFRMPAEALQLARSAFDKAPRSSPWFLWQTLGIAHYRAGNWTDSIAAIEQSMKIRKNGDCEDAFFLAMAHWQRGDPGDKKQARVWYDRAVGWMNKYDAQSEEARRLCTEAAALLGIKDNDE